MPQLGSIFSMTTGNVLRINANRSDDFSRACNDGTTEVVTTIRVILSTLAFSFDSILLMFQMILLCIDIDKETFSIWELRKFLERYPSQFYSWINPINPEQIHREQLSDHRQAARCIDSGQRLRSAKLINWHRKFILFSLVNLCQQKKEFCRDAGKVTCKNDSG